jgi:hypothetical protein
MMVAPRVISAPTEVRIVHSLVRFAPFALALFAAIPAFADVTQPAKFELRTGGTTPTTETVVVKVNVYENGGECPNAGPNPCILRMITIHVTPCPIGSPCINGAYEFTYVGYSQYTTLLTLERGQKYTFTGQVSSNLGLPEAGPCNSICTFLQPITTLEYTGGQDPPPPTWDVVQDHIENNLMWVNVRLLNPYLTGPCTSELGPCTGLQSARLNITPCPVQILNWGQGCGSAYGAPVETVFHVALEIGKSYTISGGQHTYGLTEELHGGCVESGCEYDNPAANKTFDATLVATRPITWGAVKSMYRN